MKLTESRVYAPVAQWIRRSPAEAEIRVQLTAGVPDKGECLVMKAGLEELHRLVHEKKSWLYKYVPDRWISAEEGAVIAKICEKNDIDFFVESGTASGYSACWAATVCKEVHTFDPVDRAKVYEEKAFGFQQLGGTIQYYEEGFIPKAAEVAAGLDGNIAFFLDGDRAHVGRQKDWESIQHLVKEGDIVIQHDGRQSNVAKLSDAIAKKCNGALRVYDTQYGLTVVHVGKRDGVF